MISIISFLSSYNTLKYITYCRIIIRLCIILINLYRLNCLTLSNISLIIFITNLITVVLNIIYNIYLFYKNIK